jgi:excisionase family DNA binding protein
MSDRLLTAREVADLLGHSPETILRWTRLGKLPGIRLPSGQLRYRAEAIDEWLAARETQGAGTGDRESPNARAHAHREGSLATSAEGRGRLLWQQPNARPPRAAARPKEDNHAT